MPATPHTDVHTLPHCGQCMLNFSNDIEFLEHLEQVAHEAHIFFKCAGCGAENIEVKEKVKQVDGEVVARFCEPCLKIQADKYAQLLKDKAEAAKKK